MLESREAEQPEQEEDEDLGSDVGNADVSSTESPVEQETSDTSNTSTSSTLTPEPGAAHNESTDALIADTLEPEAQATLGSVQEDSETSNTSSTTSTSTTSTSSPEPEEEEENDSEAQANSSSSGEHGTLPDREAQGMYVGTIVLSAKLAYCIGIHTDLQTTDAPIAETLDAHQADTEAPDAPDTVSDLTSTKSEESEESDDSEDIESDAVEVATGAPGRYVCFSLLG